MSWYDVYFLLGFSLHVLEVSTVVAEDYLSGIVEEDAGWAIGEEVSQAVFWGVVNPFFDIDLLGLCSILHSRIKIILIINIRELILRPQLPCRARIWLHCDFINITNLSIPALEVLKLS